VYEEQETAALMQSAEASPRDDAWLRERLRLLWEMHFADVPIGYPITVRFGTRARYRFGSISARDGKTLILINQLFADPYVPTFVVDETLAHELVHYAHGFNSGLPRRHTHAHRGGVVDKELQQRGLGTLSARAEQWRDTHWDAYYAACCDDLLVRHTARTDHASAAWDRFLTQPGQRTEEELRGRLHLLTPRLGFASDQPPYTVEWLRATRRQNGTSYWFARSQVVRLHGLLADRRVPGVLVDFELAYWLAQRAVGARWQAIHAALCRADMEGVAEEALRWRRHAWTSFCNRHHPLKTAERNTVR
jgi:hypothetical protein